MRVVQDCNDYLCGVCEEAHSKTRLTKSHTIHQLAAPPTAHPRLDEAEGRKVASYNQILQAQAYPTPPRIYILSISYDSVGLLPYKC